jgi:tRNA(Ile)-lysidine synthase
VSRITQAFLNVHWDRATPLLLGYSGGPDSKALLYALLECGVKPHIAHVDHGWRSESADEAALLKREAEELGCPFFTTRLQIEKKEDAARKARFAFFQSLSGYQALLLAHHADDLAETALKRVLEGAHLPFLGGMEPISRQYGMTIWRPFLSIRRFEILQFLQEKALAYFTDASNSDPAYLRARMRLEIFPFLHEQFGKETVDNLALLATRASELKAFLEKRVANAPIYRGPWGLLALLDGLEKIERRYLLQKLAREEEFVIPREKLEMLLDKEGSFESKGRKIWVDKGRAFLFSLGSTGSSSGACG